MFKADVFNSKSTAFKTHIKDVIVNRDTQIFKIKDHFSCFEIHIPNALALMAKSIQ